jgi:predicted methyltransferase
MMLRSTLFAAALLAPLAFVAPATAATAATVKASAFDAAIAGSHRSAPNRARDTARNPAQTLAFFGVKPTDTVVEISPAGGWYTEILAPYLHDKGLYYAAHNNPAGGPGAVRGIESFKAKLASTPAAYGKVQMTAFGKGADAIAPAGSADKVLSFRNVHNWYMADYAPEAFKAFFKALKPGGTLGIVEHRLPESSPDAAMKESGFMKISYVKKLAADAGFKFVEASDVNANARDTKDYPKGVWTLPPNYAEGDTDKAKYMAIGESDRMTLKFVKRR